MPIDSNLLKGYQTALTLAVKNLRSADPKELASGCSAGFDEDAGAFSLEYLAQPYIIDWPSGDVRRADSKDEVQVTTRVLLLNYLISARAQTLRGELISFRDLPGAATYEPSFQKRAVAPLIRTFDGKAEILLAAGEKLGGMQGEVADTSIVIRVLPLLEVTYALWHSDDEFPAHGSILFDSSTKRLMSAECMVVAASNGVYRLMDIARQLTQS